MSIKYASIVMQLEDGSVVQRPLSIEERRFIIAILGDEKTLKVFPCTGVAFQKNKALSVLGKGSEVKS